MLTEHSLYICYWYSFCYCSFFDKYRIKHLPCLKLVAYLDERALDGKSIHYATYGKLTRNGQSSPLNFDNLLVYCFCAHVQSKRPALRKLAKEILNIIIQEGEHSSVSTILSIYHLVASFKEMIQQPLVNVQKSLALGTSQ